MSELMEAPSLDAGEDLEQDNPFTLDGSKLGLDISPAFTSKKEKPIHYDIEPRITGTADLNALDALAVTGSPLLKKVPHPVDEHGITELETKTQFARQPLEVGNVSPEKIETRQHSLSSRKIGEIMNKAVSTAKPEIPAFITTQSAGPSAAEENISDIPETGLSSPEVLKQDLKSIKDKNILQENRSTRAVAMAEYKDLLKKERPGSIRAKHIEVLISEQQLATKYIQERINEVSKGGIFKKIGGWFKRG